MQHRNDILPRNPFLTPDGNGWAAGACRTGNCATWASRAAGAPGAGGRPGFTRPAPALPG
ncbi:hypothetical protein EYF70_08275 [Pseudoduganella albidiflava]|uniref:Uncharacterized protein n=1 Tax=Pseudoduganella albidiflava TaxID=321983 RepID=A0ABX5RQQ1_9BURK|nr:hypothetical protein EYF70_08275 [Pseudoduganella albidiflava]